MSNTNLPAAHMLPLSITEAVAGLLWTAGVFAPIAAQDWRHDSDWSVALTTLLVVYMPEFFTEAMIPERAPEWVRLARNGASS